MLDETTVAVSGAYLLLGLVARARPLGDDVFFGLGVCRKGKGDAGEGGALEAVSACATLARTYSQSRCRRSAGPWSGPHRRPLPRRRACCIAAAAGAADGRRAAGRHTGRAGEHLRTAAAAAAVEDSLEGRPAGVGIPSAAAGAGTEAGRRC